MNKNTPITISIVCGLISIGCYQIGKHLAANETGKNSANPILMTESERILFHPGYSYCERCGRTWDVVDSHVTWLPTGGNGHFCLCRDCWAKTTPEERVAYYKLDFNKYWLDQNWNQIKQSVLTDTNLP